MKIFQSDFCKHTINKTIKNNKCIHTQTNTYHNADYIISDHKRNTHYDHQKSKMQYRLKKKIKRKCSFISQYNFMEKQFVCHCLYNEEQHHRQYCIKEQTYGFGTYDQTSVFHLTCYIFHKSARYICRRIQDCKDDHKHRNGLSFYICKKHIENRNLFPRFCRRRHIHSKIHLTAFLFFHCIFIILLPILKRICIHFTRCKRCCHNHKNSKNCPDYIEAFCFKHTEQFHSYHIKHCRHLLSDSENNFQVLRL